MKKGYFILIIIIVISSCTTVTNVEPVDHNNSLVIGHITWDNELNDKQRGNIILEFEDIITREIKEFTAKTKDGMFYFLASPNTEYELVKVHIMVKESGKDELVRYTSSLNKREQHAKFDVKPGKVFNLGYIDWNSKITGTNTPNASITQVYVNTDIKDLFMEKYPKSAWILYDWIEVELKR